MTPQAVLIGLDGATFTVLDPLMAKGVMPFLRDFAARGVRAPLRSVVPALTPPAWTSLVTGKRPGHHGVFDFFQRESPDSQYFRLATTHDIGSDTIWSLASQHGRRLLALNFPVMFPPPAVNGCVVPGGWMPWRQLRLGCHPLGLFDRLKALPSFNARELALDMAFEEKAIEGCATGEYLDWVALHTRREQRWFEILSYLMAEEPADLVAVVFDGPDKLQHLCWQFLDPTLRPATPSPWEQEVQALCEDYFRQLDGLIAQIVTLAGPDASVVLASDHGFGATSDVLFLNTWLEQQGYLVWSTARPETTDEDPRLGLGQIARHVYQLNWERTVAYAATPSSNGIHIVTRAPGSSAGVPPEEYEQVRAEIAQRLRGLRHPATGRPIVAEVWTREQVFAGPFEALAPDLTLVLEDGGLVSILQGDSAIKPRARPVGTHRPDGIFLASGPGMRSGVRLPELSILDVAPLLLYRLDLPVPDDVDGRIPVDVLDPEVLRRRPPRLVAGRPPPHVLEAAATSRPNAADAEADVAVLKRLRALGYVE